MTNCKAIWLLSLICIPLLGTAARAQKLYFAPPSYPGSGQAITADFNGDGKPDLISNDGTILLGKGDGTFTQGTSISLCPCISLATADFNGDGKPDLALSTSSTNSFSILLGNGDGTFQAPLTTSTPAPLLFLAVGDLNGDGKPDVLVLPTVGSGLVSYLGKGDGTFASGVNAGGQSAGILGDFNGDGKLDLATTVAVQLGNGDGTFQTPISFTAGPFQGTLFEAAGDFSGDGKLDLALSSTGSGGPSLTQVLLGNGDGTFQPAVTVGSFGGSITAADVNKDGKSDLILQQFPFVQALLSNGDGTFKTETPYNLNPTTAVASSPTVADFNGDGKADVAAANTLLLGNGDGTFKGDPGIVGVSGPAIVGDFNHDGFPDLAVMIGPVNNGTFTQELAIFLNDGTGALTLAYYYNVPVFYMDAGDAIAAAVDLNGDGKLDLILYSQYMSDGFSMLGNGDGSFQPPVVFPNNTAGPSITGMTLADLTGDGKPDVIEIAGAFHGSPGAMYVLLGNGDGTFTAPVQYYAGQGDGNVVSADFNGDGKVDSAVGTSNGIELLLGNGDGTFQPATSIPTSLGSNYARWLATGDLNNDGNPDLIASGETAFEVLLGGGNGKFNGLTPTSDSTNGTLSLADLNGDGNLDVLGVGSGGTELGYLLGNGDGTFGSFQPVVPLSGVPYIADFNGDGQLDIAVIRPGGLFYLFNTGSHVSLDFQVSASALSPPTVTPGNSATATITITPVAGFNGTLTLTCSGAPSTATCTVSPTSIMLDGTNNSSANVLVTTQAATAVLQMPSDRPARRQSWPLLAAWLSATALLGISLSVVSVPRGWRARSLFPRVTIGLVACALFVLPSCGSGPSGSGGGNGGTPPGTYLLTITAAGSGAGAITHSATLNLIVQ